MKCYMMSLLYTASIHLIHDSCDQHFMGHSYKLLDDTVEHGICKTAGETANYCIGSNVNANYFHTA